MYWFEKQSYKDFHACLLAEVNAASSNDWINSSYNNDACGSVMFELTDDGENYVQLFAFENKEDAVLELGEGGTQYSITVCKNGEHDYTIWEDDSRDEAIQRAALFAVKLREEYVPTIEDEEDGFEHEGVWVTDRTKSPCGRFDLTPEQSREIYGDK